MVLSDSGRVLQSTSAFAGETGSDGDASAVTVAVGSLNPVKVEAVRSVLEAAFGSARVIPKKVSSGVPEQPFGEQTPEGAKNRAAAALGDCDFSVGIEAGVFELEDGLYDVQYCAVLDRRGRVSIGMGPGFRYPDDVADAVRSGETVGHAVKRLRGDSGGRGAIWLLSNGLIDRFELTRQSVLAAMVPRLSGATLSPIGRA
ncbi:MAG: inosine/xanthosine triphosphatase [Thermoplasmatales archaeon]|nr:inosine/xanthosine triphosphatase [Thermoplasmatales archaeon]